MEPIILVVKGGLCCLGARYWVASSKRRPYKLSIIWSKLLSLLYFLDLKCSTAASTQLTAIHVHWETEYQAKHYYTISTDCLHIQIAFNYIVFLRLR